MLFYGLYYKKARKGYCLQTHFFLKHFVDLPILLWDCSPRRFTFSAWTCLIPGFREVDFYTACPQPRENSADIAGAVSSVIYRRGLPWGQVSPKA